MIVCMECKIYFRTHAYSVYSYTAVVDTFVSVISVYTSSTRVTHVVSKVGGGWSYYILLIYVRNKCLQLYYIIYLTY